MFTNTKVALITGAANGNGFAITEKFLSEGFSCFVVDRDPSLLDLISSTWHDYSGNIHGLCSDLSQQSSFEEIVSSFRSVFAKLDVLINNAGLSRSASPEDYSFNDWDLTLNVNLKAPFFLVQAFLKANLFSNPASIINITSLAAEQGFPSNPAYLASKGGLKQLSKGLAMDLSSRGIRVNCVGPGYIRTAMTKGSWDNQVLRDQRNARMISNRWGESIDVANACFFLASSDANYINAQDIYVDGGWLSKGL